MKSILLSLFFISLLFLNACNSGGKKPKPRDGEPVSMADSLMKEIDDIHIKGMSKMAQLTRLQSQVRARIDSIAKLNESQQKPIAAYKRDLDSLIKDLEFAEFSMDKWMMDFYDNPDTLSDKPAERENYLVREKQNAERIRDGILNGISRADSLLYKKN
jgi:hypothetical protein